jgi:hypothetical protein
MGLLSMNKAAVSGANVLAISRAPAAASPGRMQLYARRRD